jgi:chromosome segregation protein
MRLERLEIAGFKSFSDRAELSFDRGVTAIVGPNGCGKSNVADAITWVMGEQSAKSLRGEKMEDVIFSGSDARKPTGAAEVRLRLSGVTLTPVAFPGGLTTRHEPPAVEAAGNGSGHGAQNRNGNGNGHGPHVAELLDAVREVEVTRRLYRSGESEYLIDGQVCRLKDIHELLMDTGLGAKAYSIIEQGKIGMILSSRPTDRRQLIEEAAGITKYKARRRAAELKLEAAQQNLTRIDDIVYEVERQRGSLKRQAAKARRYTRLRDEMRRWEKVLFARRYRSLAELIEGARARLAGARDEQAGAQARLAEVENELARLRIELAEAESAANRVRDRAHARELEINRRQQQIALDTQQAEMLQTRGAELDAERAALEARREPERVALEARRQAAREAGEARDRAAVVASAAAAEYLRAQQTIEGLEQHVEQARGEVYAVLNTVTALTAALESAGAQRERAAEVLARLDVEASDLGNQHARATAARSAAATVLARAHDALDAARIARAAQDAELENARAEHEWRARDVRAREHELASLAARLRSLEELDAHRAGFGDAARMVLVQANGRVGQMGALADVIEAEPRYERAVEACLGERLQHVLVRRHDHASAGLALVREQGAGRCGFVVVDPDASLTSSGRFGETAGQGASSETAAAPFEPRWLPPDAVMLSSVITVAAAYQEAVRAAIGDAVIVDTFEAARDLAPRLPLPVATLAGDVLHGAHLVAGGGKVEARGILGTKREIKELRERVADERAALERLSNETAHVEQTIAQLTAAIAALAADVHRQEKGIVAVEGQLQRAGEDEQRLAQRAEIVGTEMARTREEIAALEARQAEARESIARLDEQKREADLVLAEAQRTLLAARETADASAQRAAEARAAHAALVERSAAGTADVDRLAQAARELERRVETCASDLALMRDQRQRLLSAAAEGQRAMDEEVKVLESLRDDMRTADDKAAELKALNEQQEDVIRDARRALDAVRALAAELDVTRATAEADLVHVAQQCIDAVAMSVDDVRAEVEQMEAAGDVEPDVRAIRAVEAPDADELDEGDALPAPAHDADSVPGSAADAAAASDEPAPVRMTAEEAIAELRGKIDKLGPVNMMAIDQFAELDTRHTFLTTQRKDLVDSIAQTNEAIRRIDETTHARFKEAFAAINANFQQTFATLFGGGRAGLTLLDESDPLESGIDIVASPPGKRLQSVQLLSGGEKALAAIALMFAIFRYKPSPFCLLDEIDAPLDDANIGRFVEMLRSMMDRTQFIVITHNRKTMEIANRLYGVTMEEPGVSKLISIQLN